MQEKIEREFAQRGKYISSLQEIENDPKGCNDKRFEELKEALKGYNYWVFENNNGRFVFTNLGLFFQSEMVDKDFERFPFFENDYFRFKKKFIDYSVIGFDENIYLLLLFENKRIKPLKVNGCFCGDIVVHDDTKTNDFHFSCGHAMINNEKIVVVKPFRMDIRGYKFENIKGNNFTGLY